MKKNFISLIFLAIILQNNSYCQVDPVSIVVSKFLQKRIKDLYTIEKLRSMTSLEGRRTVNYAYNNAEEEVNNYYDNKVERENNRYASCIR